ncbi:unnamed protein product [Peronospora belbahrii]|uniref:Peptidase S54 rhomboid domain-containing protein n=1 Tax=Peronospora belbahrii TaxID=622444 RepID=A0AAU9KN70_9STRA|nr:unnamed protein product [Peronospora belbahrii]CAH0518351.1 unnamed protein product [Peronospora belbahrii]
MYGPSIRRRARGGRDIGYNDQAIALIVMLLRQVHQLEHKPPVTLGLMVLMCGIHFQKNETPERFVPYYLCPDQVIRKSDYMRIVISGLIHVDEWHLYHNMISFLWKGYNLESKLGSVRFLFTISYLLVLCHTLVVIVSLVLATRFQIPGPLYQCSVGFSGVLFALKVLLNHNSPTFSSIYGFQVPTKYAAWLELVAIHFLVPRTSFMGHMCGVLAGYMFVYSPSIQTTMNTGSRWIRRWLETLMKPIANRRNIDPQTASYHASRTSTRTSTTSIETDEELARRLQEEEYQAARIPREQHEADQLTRSELRRRRIARFSSGQRSINRS